MENIRTIDCITGEIIDIISSSMVFVDIIDDCIVTGYTAEPCIERIFYMKDSQYKYYVPLCRHLPTIYDNRVGGEVVDYGISKRDKVFAKYCKGRGFPYQFRKRYEAIECFNLFNGKQNVLEDEKFPIANVFKYTFGLEFETSSGLIPEEICFRDGLIPLRDGSISGNEYSTVVLEGNSGFNLLYQQLKTLRQYTRFDKECSLHIHLGGYPLIPEKILSLYNLCYFLQNDIRRYVPKYTFFTSKYKASGKDYCKLLQKGYDNFRSYYIDFTGENYFGDLHQAHRDDITRERKWNIHQRYYWANLLNLICYHVNKTMEFRLLRPTYNLEKILTWMYIFNAIHIYAENHSVSESGITLMDVLREVYPVELFEKLEIQLYKLEVCVIEQNSAGDYIGNRTDIDDEIFDKDNII